MIQVRMGTAAGVLHKRVDVVYSKDVGIEKARESFGEIRRRNSLMFNIVRYIKATEGMNSYETIRKDLLIEIERKKELRKDIRRKNLTKKLLKIGDSILRGNGRELKHQVNRNFKKINRVYDDYDGNTLLHMACQEGYVEMVELILDPRAHASFDEVAIDHTVQNERHRIALLLCFTPPTATYNGLLYGVNPSSGEAIAHKPEGIVAPGDWIQPGNASHREKCIKLLLQRGADPNTRDFHEITPLHFASIWGWAGAAQALVAKGADVNALNAQGKTPLMLCCEYLRSAVVDVLVCSRAIDLNLADRDGYTALVTVAEKGGAGGLEITRALLAGGADPNIETRKRKSALFFACKSNDLELVTALLDHDAFRNEGVLALLTGEVARVVGERLALEQAEARHKQLLAETDRKALAREGAIDVVTEGYRLRPAFGAWIEYKDTRTKQLFYYNPVTRQSQWDIPDDFLGESGGAGRTKSDSAVGATTTNKLKLKGRQLASSGVKEGIFGMHFYH